MPIAILIGVPCSLDDVLFRLILLKTTVLCHRPQDYGSYHRDTLRQRSLFQVTVWTLIFLVGFVILHIISVAEIK
jgi:hypothetical protein